MSDIKKCFTSRFWGGYIVDADFSQLEVIGAAILSRDPALKSDIVSGLDMHRKRASDLFRKLESDITDDERRQAKALSFMLQYGAGAPHMSEQTGLDVGLCRDFIDQYYSRYRTLKAWQDDVRKEVHAGRYPTRAITPGGLPRGASKWNSITGRIYTFKEHDSPTWMKTGTGFSPTQIKNFPVQGFATGDIMAIYRAMLFDETRDSTMFLRKVLPINSVHDSIMYDVESGGDLLKLKSVLLNCAKLLPTALANHGVDPFGMTFPMEIKAGPNWGEMKVI